MIGIGDAEHIRGELVFGREVRFRHFKTKAGIELADDLARAEAILDVLEAGETLGVDANAGWSPVVAQSREGRAEVRACPCGCVATSWPRWQRTCRLPARATRVHARGGPRGIADAEPVG